MTKLSEDQLCELFADGVRDMPEFCCWLLNQTKFACHANSCRLLHEEQMSIRPRRKWWRHWWCAVPHLSEQRETDIFMVFEVSNRERFALHIENKKDNFKFSPGQAAAYGPRAAHMLNKSEFLSYSDFQTALLAPKSFRDRYTVDANLFDFFIAYEEVAAFLPSFAVS